MKTVAVLGSGTVGERLSDGFLRFGYTVVRGTRDPEKLQTWRAGAGKRASVATFVDAAARGDLVVLAVKGSAAQSAVELCAPSLEGKTVIDATNPIADAPPTNGVLSFFTGPNDSLMERLQRTVPGAHFVKAFSCIGSPLMVKPEFAGGLPTMFICGNDVPSKLEVRTILEQFGWQTEDLGTVEAARAIEPLCILWCIPGFVGGSWNHAFKLLK